MKKINNYAGLEYVTLCIKKDRVPMKTALELEKLIAREIITSRPIRGKELRFLRGQLGLSCAKLSLAIHGALCTSAISKLEKKEEVRLSQVNEVYFRIFFAEKFNVDIAVSSKELVPEESSELIEVAA